MNPIFKLSRYSFPFDQIVYIKEGGDCYGIPAPTFAVILKESIYNGKTRLYENPIILEEQEYENLIKQWAEYKELQETMAAANSIRQSFQSPVINKFGYNVRCKIFEYHHGPQEESLNEFLVGVDVIDIQIKVEPGFTSGESLDEYHDTVQVVYVFYRDTGRDEKSS